MSQRVVRYEGEGRRRRPVYADEGPASASAHDPLASLERVSVLDVRGSGLPMGGAGPVERRQITEAELALRRPTPPAPPRPLFAPTPEIQEEGPAMTDAAEPETRTSPLAELVTASMEADEAYEAFAQASRRWDVARGRLTTIWSSAREVVEPGSAIAAVLQEELAQVGIRKVDATEARGITDRLMGTIGPGSGKPVSGTAVGGGPGESAPDPVVPKRRRPGGDKGRAESIEERGRRVLEVLERHGGDTKAAGAELGMRGNVVARIAQSARAREAVAS